MAKGACPVRSGGFGPVLLGLCPGGGFQHPGTAFSFWASRKASFRVGHSVLRLPGSITAGMWRCTLAWPCCPFPEPAAGSFAGPRALPADAGAAVPDGSSGATPMVLAPAYWVSAYPLLYYVLGAAIRRFQPKIPTWAGLTGALGIAVILGPARCCPRTAI